MKYKIGDAVSWHGIKGTVLVILDNNEFPVEAGALSEKPGEGYWWCRFTEDGKSHVHHDVPSLILMEIK